MTDLLALTAQLVDIPSESFEERAIADHLEAELRAIPWLTVTRVGDNVVARTNFGCAQRIILAGHTDTVPANGNGSALIEGDVLRGLGSADMKGGLAVMLELARTVQDPAVDATYVFYVAEEVAPEHSGLAHLFAERPELLQGDVALLGEPTDGGVEAGCQGSMRMRITFAGVRAHPARPWMGRNAIHRAGALLSILEGYQERRPVIDGCEFREALQAVWIEGGVAGNVVPDRAVVTVNHRFAPDRTPEQAENHVRELIAPVFEDGDTFEMVDFAAGAMPSVEHPLVAALVSRGGFRVSAKLGWTDVARFATNGVPAANFGPGDARVAHAPDEHVELASIERCFRALDDLLRHGA